MIEANKRYHPYDSGTDTGTNAGCSVTLPAGTQDRFYILDEVVAYSDLAFDLVLNNGDGSNPANDIWTLSFPSGSLVEHFTTKGLPNTEMTLTISASTAFCSLFMQADLVKGNKN